MTTKETTTETPKSNGTTTQAAPPNTTGAQTPPPVQSTALATLAGLTPEAQAWELAKSKAQALSKSSIVPPEFQGKPANCIIAIDLAERTGLPVLMVCQNLHIINGRPGWGSAFLIGSVNSSKRFTPLRYEWQGTPGTEDRACRAIAKDVKTGEVLDGTWITMAMVRAEGWLDKKGSKWLTMPEQMFKYRAAAFWTRTYCPEIALGLLTQEELGDMPEAYKPPDISAATNTADALDAEILGEEKVDPATGEITMEPKS